MSSNELISIFVKISIRKMATYKHQKAKSKAEKLLEQYAEPLNFQQNYEPKKR